MAKFTKYNNPSKKRKYKSRENFWTWLKRVHNMSELDYWTLNEFQRKALEIEYDGRR